MLDIMEIVINIIKDYGYIAIFIIIFLECCAVFFLPGDSLLFAIGILAVKGHINIYVAVSVIIVAAILGGETGYYIGKYFEKISENKYLKKIFHTKKIEEAAEYFKKHGEKTILFARFVPVIRTFVPAVAGFSFMNKKKFSKYNFLGAVLWGVTIPFAAYTAGERFPALEQNITLVSLVIIIITLTPFGVKYANIKIKNYKKSKIINIEK
jgi:membrane-associated protein